MTLMPSLTSPAISGIPHVRHGFFTRQGGVSSGIHASLNCGRGGQDDPANVTANRAGIARSLGCEPAALVTVYQCHSAVAVITPAALNNGILDYSLSQRERAGVRGLSACTTAASFGPSPCPLPLGEGQYAHEPVTGLTLDISGAPSDEKIQADAMVTTTPGLVLGILTADCVPILFSTRDGKVIGAAHAGWRGALEGIVAATVSRMVECGAVREAITAVIGHCIRQDSYQVGPDFRATFVAHDTAFARLFIQDGDKYRFDLPGFVRLRLEQEKIAAIDDIGLDTYADPERFFSYRRATHAGEPDYGRQMSAIAIVKQ